MTGTGFAQAFYMMTRSISKRLNQLHLALFICASCFLTPSVSYSALVCLDIFSKLNFNSGPRELPREIFSADGFEVFRGLSVTATNLQIEQLFTKEYGLKSVQGVQNAKQEQMALSLLPKGALSDMTVEQLAPYVLQHASGILISKSLFLSSTFDIGVANYFSTQGQGKRSLIIHFRAPPDSINVTAFARKRPFQERGEAEVMVPLKIPAENIIQILEVDHSSNGSVVIGRWYFENFQLLHERLDNLPLPDPRRRSIHRLGY